VVVTTRHDDHGGDPLRRLQTFVNTFAAQCRRTQLSAEINVVEWNPPADRKRVGELLRVPADAPCAVHVIEVPPEIHRTIRYADVLPLFQMIAKNVGIRRARGRFILATNIDIIFSNELVEYLASGQLASGYRYRVNRHDIQSDYPVDGSLAEQMAYCQTHQLRLHTRSGTHHVDSRGHLRTAPHLHGLEAFFRTKSSNPPPLWKMALATYIGVEVVTLTLALTLGPALRGWSLFIANPFQNIFVVGLLTWVVMPVVTNVLSGWLHNNKE
jgi:hypothetical protein